MLLVCLRCGVETPSGRPCRECGGATLVMRDPPPLPMAMMLRKRGKVDVHPWQLSDQDKLLLRALKITPE